MVEVAVEEGVEASEDRRREPPSMIEHYIAMQIRGKKTKKDKKKEGFWEWRY